MKKQMKHLAIAGALSAAMLAGNALQQSQPVQAATTPETKTPVTQDVLTVAKQAVADAQTEATQAQADQAAAAQRITELTEQLDTAQANLTELQALSENKAEAIQAAKNGVAVVTTQLADAKAALDQANADQQAKQAALATAQTALDQATAATKQAEADAAKAVKDATAPAQKAVDTAQGAVDAAQDAVDSQQGVVDAAQKAVGTNDPAAAQKAVDQAQKTADAANQAQTTAETAKTGATQAVAPAQTAVNSAQQTADDANQAQAQAQTAVVNATTASTTANKAVTDAQAAVDQAGVHLPNTLVMPDGVDGEFFDRIFNGGDNFSNEDIAVLSKGLDINQYVKSPADLNVKIQNAKDLTPEMLNELAQFAADLINQIRTVTGMPKVTVTEGAMAFAKAVAAGYDADNWNMMEDATSWHDTNAINSAAKDAGLSYGGTSNFYEDLYSGLNAGFMTQEMMDGTDPRQSWGDVNSNPYLIFKNNDGNNWYFGDLEQKRQQAGEHTLADVRKSVWDAIVGMMFEDGRSGLGHTRSLTGYTQHDDTYYFGLSVDKYGQIHLIDVAKGYIFQDSPNAAAMETPIASTDDQALAKALDDAKTAAATATTALTNAKTKLTQAQTTATNAANQLNTAKSALTKANQAVTTAETALTNAKAAATKAAGALSAAKQTLATAQASAGEKAQTLAAAKAKLAELQTPLAVAKQALADKQTALKNETAAAQKTADAKVATAKAAQAKQQAFVDAATKALTAAQSQVKAEQDFMESVTSALADAYAQVDLLDHLDERIEEAEDAIATLEPELAKAQIELDAAKATAAAKAQALKLAKARLAGMTLIETVAKRAPKPTVKPAGTRLTTAKPTATLAATDSETAGKGDLPQAGEGSQTGVLGVLGATLLGMLGLASFKRRA